MEAKARACVLASHLAPRGHQRGEDALPARPGPADQSHTSCTHAACAAAGAHEPEELGVVVEAMAKLRATYRAGHTFKVRWRKQQLDQLKKMMTAHRDEIVQAVCTDLGKKHSHEVFVSEINVVMSELDLAIEKISEWVAPERRSTPLILQPSKSYVFKDPLGVVLIISPWNYPVNLALVPLIGAIAAGNCTFLKLSRHSSFTSNLLHMLLHRYLDTRALCIDASGGAAMISALTAVKWDHVFFTGSCSVGRIVYERAAKFLTPVTLELGGKNPCIIDGSVDMALVARRVAWGKFFNAGQTCIGVDYVILPHHMERSFVQEMRMAIHDFYGEDPMKSTSFPRIISKHHTRRLRKLMGDGTVECGGVVDVERQYVAPTVITNIKEGSLLLEDEIFGPILAVVCVANVEQAIEYIEERPKPLALYLFSDNYTFQRKVLKRTRSGSVVVNDCLIQFANHNIPFGGVGESGLGAYHGKLTFETFTHNKAVVMSSSRSWLDIPLKYPPYSDNKTWMVEKVAALGW